VVFQTADSKLLTFIAIGFRQYQRVQKGLGRFIDTTPIKSSKRSRQGCTMDGP